MEKDEDSVDTAAKEEPPDKVEHNPERRRSSFCLAKLGGSEVIIKVQVHCNALFEFKFKYNLVYGFMVSITKACLLSPSTARPCGGNVEADSVRELREIFGEDRDGTTECQHGDEGQRGAHHHPGTYLLSAASHGAPLVFRVPSSKKSLIVFLIFAI